MELEAETGIGPDRVSLQWVCDHAVIVRYHPSGGGYGSPWTFAVTVATDDEGEWWFCAASGSYTVDASRRIRRALSDAGLPRVRMLRGYGARERVITRTALSPPWIRYRREVIVSDLSYGVTAKSDPSIEKGQPGYFSWALTNAYEDLGPDDAAAVVGMSNGIAAAVKKASTKDGELTVTLFSTVDGAPQADQVYRMTREALSRVQLDLWGEAGDFLKQGHLKQKSKHDHGKKKH